MSIVEGFEKFLIQHNSNIMWENIKEQLKNVSSGKISRKDIQKKIPTPVLILYINYVLFINYVVLICGNSLKILEFTDLFIHERVEMCMLQMY